MIRDERMEQEVLTCHYEPLCDLTGSLLKESVNCSDGRRGVSMRRSSNSWSYVGMKVSKRDHVSLPEGASKHSCDITVTAPCSSSRVTDDAGRPRPNRSHILEHCEPSRSSRYTANMPVDVDACVTSNVHLSDDYNVVRLDAPKLAVSIQPGQFVMIKPIAGLEPLLRRPFSIFEVLTNRNGVRTGFALLNKRVGIGTELLYSIEVGHRIGCLGPLGVPFTVVAPPHEAWLVAGGVGLAPFLTLAADLRGHGTATTLFYGGRRSADLYYLDAFTQLGVRLVLTTEDGSQGESGLVTAPLERALVASAVSAQPTLYACGPTPMMSAVASLATAHGRPCQVSLEPIMGCGMGGCYSCVVPIRKSGNDPAHLVRACLEGPVFDGQRVVWDRLQHVA